MSDCPWCRQPLKRADQSLPIEDRDGVLVAFRRCPTCDCLLPCYPNANTETVDETNAQVEYHEELWHDLDHVDLDFDLVRGRVLAREIRSHFPDGTRPTIAEIGFGRGNLLFAMRRQGFDVIGCEPSKELYKVARQAYALPAEAIACVDAETFLADLTASGRRVDAVMFWHVLEHLRHPGATLAAYRQQYDDAAIFAEFPVAIREDIFPEHLNFPTPKTLLHMATSLDIGIQEIGIVGDVRLRVIFDGRPQAELPDNYIETVSDYLAASTLSRDFYQRSCRG